MPKPQPHNGGATRHNGKNPLFPGPKWCWLNLVDAIHLTKLQNIDQFVQAWGFESIFQSQYILVCNSYSWWAIATPIWQICCLSNRINFCTAFGWNQPKNKKNFETTLPISVSFGFCTYCMIIESLQGFHLWWWKFPESSHCCVGWPFQQSTPITSRDKTSPATNWLHVGILKM